MTTYTLLKKLLGVKDIVVEVGLFHEASSQFDVILFRHHFVSGQNNKTRGDLKAQPLAQVQSDRLSFCRLSSVLQFH